MVSSFSNVLASDVSPADKKPPVAFEIFLVAASKEILDELDKSTGHLDNKEYIAIADLIQNTRLQDIQALVDSIEQKILSLDELKRTDVDPKPKSWYWQISALTWCLKTLHEARLVIRDKK